MSRPLLNSVFRLAHQINVGTDGDLSREDDWIILWSAERLPVHACPALYYDSVNGHYYMTGGGSTQDGPFRTHDFYR